MAEENKRDYREFVQHSLAIKRKIKKKSRSYFAIFYFVFCKPPFKNSLSRGQLEKLLCQMEAEDKKLLYTAYREFLKESIEIMASGKLAFDTPEKFLHLLGYAVVDVGTLGDLRKDKEVYPIAKHFGIGDAHKVARISDFYPLLAVSKKTERMRKAKQAMPEFYREFRHYIEAPESGRGVGGILLDKIIADLKKARVKLVYLMAIGGRMAVFYKKHNFKEDEASGFLYLKL